VLAIDGCHIATVDGAGTEHPVGYLVMQDDRIAAVGPGPLPARYADAQRIDGSGRLATPGLVNTHHHLYQWITRGYATDDTLFGWLTTLYPVWARLDADLVHASAAANLGWLALTGCSTTTDHHYVFPAGRGDLLEAEILAARQIGLRFHPARGSMNLGQSAGGLPPDTVVESHDDILAATQAAVDRWHDPSPGAMTRIAVAPCSPFSVTAELMRDSAELARRAGVRMHTHLAETLDEEEFCLATYGRTPAQYAEDLGWLGRDVWLAHCVHLSGDAIGRLAATGTGVAHCPTSNGRLGSGIAPVRALLEAGAPVGLGVDGSASNESGRMIDELHQALRAVPVPGRPAGVVCPGVPADGDDGRRPLPWPRGRTGLAGSGQARRRGAVADRRPGRGRHRRPAVHAGLRRPGPGPALGWRQPGGERRRPRASRDARHPAGRRSPR
jgi:cytosine/adenosine deaminase-related metal-dependent hydrolase